MLLLFLQRFNLWQAANRNADIDHLTRRQHGVWICIVRRIHWTLLGTAVQLLTTILSPHCRNFCVHFFLIAAVPPTTVYTVVHLLWRQQWILLLQIGRVVVIGGFLLPVVTRILYSLLLLMLLLMSLLLLLCIVLLLVNILLWFRGALNDQWYTLNQHFFGWMLFLFLPAPATRFFCCWKSPLHWHQQGSCWRSPLHWHQQGSWPSPWQVCCHNHLLHHFILHV